VPSATWIAILVIFAVGLLLLAISSAMFRSLREEVPVPARAAWPSLVDDSLADADAALRLDMVERLAIVNSPWSRDVLERANTEERDARVRAAIETALRAGD
jgi:hypothetical protein